MAITQFDSSDAHPAPQAGGVAPVRDADTTSAAGGPLTPAQLSPTTSSATASITDVVPTLRLPVAPDVERPAIIVAEPRARAARASASAHEPARMPSLDGLRAVSITLVVLWHVASRAHGPVLDQLWRIDAGNLGVRTFFVISGFLITTLLLGEQRRTGRIGLGNFYVRRFFRIMPAFYAFLLAVWIVSPVLHSPPTPRDFGAAAMYLADYVHMPIALGHTWSLAVEEQFYLLWPGVLVLAGRRRAFRIALAAIVLAPVFRAASLVVPGWPDNPRYAFECVVDAIAVGCVLAGARDRLWSWEAYRRAIESRVSEAWPLLLVVIAAASTQWPRFGAILGISLLNVTIAFGIDRCVRRPGTPVGRLLNLRPIATIGVLSYSIYLWQQPFLLNERSIPLPLSIAAIAACAAASYYFVESPSLRLRSRLTRRRAATAAVAPGI